MVQVMTCRGRDNRNWHSIQHDDDVPWERYSQFWSSLWRIYPPHKSHNATVPYPTMHHFVTEMCTCVHISVTKWRTVGYLPASWEFWGGSIDRTVSQDMGSIMKNAIWRPLMRLPVTQDMGSIMKNAIWWPLMRLLPWYLVLCCTDYISKWRQNELDVVSNVSIVGSTVGSGADQRIHQSSVSLAFVRGIHRWPVNSPHKGPVTWKMLYLMTSSWIKPFCNSSEDQNEICGCPVFTWQAVTGLE